MIFIVVKLILFKYTVKYNFVYLSQKLRIRANYDIQDDVVSSFKFIQDDDDLFYILNKIK